MAGFVYILLVCYIGIGIAIICFIAHDYRKWRNKPKAYVFQPIIQFAMWSLLITVGGLLLVFFLTWVMEWICYYWYK